MAGINCTSYGIRSQQGWDVPSFLKDVLALQRMNETTRSYVYGNRTMTPTEQRAGHIAWEETRPIGAIECPPLPREDEVFHAHEMLESFSKMEIPGTYFCSSCEMRRCNSCPHTMESDV